MLSQSKILANFTVFAYVIHNTLYPHYINHDVILLFLDTQLLSQKAEYQIINECLLRKLPPLHPVNVNDVNIKSV